MKKFGIVVGILLVSLLLATVPTAFATPELWEKYNSITYMDDTRGADSTVWTGQYFTVGGVAHNFSYIKMRIYDHTTPTYTNMTAVLAFIDDTIWNDVNVTAIQSVDVGEAHLQGGPGDFPWGSWVQVNFTQYVLSADTKYGVYVKTDTPGVGGTVNWCQKISGGYLQGKGFRSTDSGVSWTTEGTQDRFFEIWGESAGGVVYTLKVESTSGGTVDPTVGEYEYDNSTEVNVTATSNSGYKLNYWTLDGANVEDDNPYLVTMNAHHTIKAYFTPSVITLGRMWEHYSLGYSDNYWLYDPLQLAQTFKVSAIPHTITAVRLYVGRMGTPEVYTVQLRTTSAGKPTTTVLVSGTFNATTFLDGMLSWQTIYFTEEYTPTVGVTYAIVLVPSATSDYGNMLSWGYDGTEPTYEDGVAVFYNGVSWAIENDKDFLFQVWGNSLAEAGVSLGAGTINIFFGLAFCLGLGGIGFGMGGGKDSTPALFLILVGLMIFYVVGWFPLWFLVLGIAILAILLATKLTRTVMGH